MGRTRHGRQTTYENNVRETYGKQRTLKSPEGLELQKNLKVGIVHFPASKTHREGIAATLLSLLCIFFISSYWKKLKLTLP